MSKVSELTGLEFAELLHEVCERLENENQNVVSVDRPKGSRFYLVNSDHEKVFGFEEHTFSKKASTLMLVWLIFHLM